MKSITIQDIKRRGISFLDADLAEGPIHVIKNNRPQYVILREEDYEEIRLLETETYLARIRDSLEDIKPKRTKRGTAQELIKELGLDD